MMNDVSCSFRHWFRNALPALENFAANQLQPADLASTFPGLDATGLQTIIESIQLWVDDIRDSTHGTSEMHSHSHVPGCREVTSVRHQHGAGLSTGEEAEQVFSVFSGQAKFFRTMRPQTFRQISSLLVSSRNYAMILRLGSRLSKKYKNALTIRHEEEQQVLELAAQLNGSGLP